MGARQVGKSTLLGEIFRGKEGVMWMNGDDWDVQQLFSTMTSNRIRALLGKIDILLWMRRNVFRISGFA